MGLGWTPLKGPSSSHEEGLQDYRKSSKRWWAGSPGLLHNLVLALQRRTSSQNLPPARTQESLGYQSTKPLSM